MPPMSSRSPALPSPRVLLCLLATWVVWGSTYLAIRVALQGFAPFVQMGSRFVVAGLLLMAWARWRGAPWPDRRQWGHALVIGALMLGGGMGGTAHAEVTVGSGLVVAFIAIGPALFALASLPFGVRPARVEVAGIGLGLVGVLMLTRGQGFQASLPGLIAILVACLTWTAGSVLTLHRLPLAPGAMGYASEMLAGGTVLLALSVAAGEPWPKAPPPAAIAAWVYLVIAGSLIAFNAYMVLLAEAPPALASSYSFVNPVIAMGLGVGLAGEVVSPFEWAAVGVVLAGVVLLVLGRRR